MNKKDKSKRLISLDALRGFTIAGMILVNVPGSWNHIYSPFRHAQFNGLTLADLVFPFFLLIVGASIVLALGKRLDQKASKWLIIKKVFYRSLVLFVLGVLLNWMSSDFSFPLRYAGVLQRIAICYLTGAVLFIYTSKKAMLFIASFILLAYWVLTIFIPLPGSADAIFTPEMNWAAWVDAKLLPGKMYFGNWDPEGILSTFPSIVSTLIGMLLCSYMLIVEDEKQKIKFFIISGIALLIAGILLSASFPINKNVWSSSYVLFTAGLFALIWSLLVYSIDNMKQIKWARPGIIFGANAISAYVLHYLMAYPLGVWQIGEHSIQSYFMNYFSAFLPAELASLFWAIIYTVICFLPIWWMYRKKIFLKI